MQTMRNLHFPMFERKTMAFCEPPDGGGQITLEDAAQAVEDVKKAFETFKEKNDGHLKEVDKKFDDVLRREELDKINDAINGMEEKIDSFAARQKRLMLSSSEDDVDYDAKALAWANLNAQRRNKPLLTEFTNEDLNNYKSNFMKYLREGEKLITPEETKALSVGTDPDGGYTVHPDMSGRVVKRIYETSPVRQHAAVQAIGTNVLEGLHDLQQAAFGWVGEVATRSETSTPQFDIWSIPVHEMYAAPRATQKLLDDSAMNIEGWLEGKVADRFARAENAAFVTGTGVNQPRGFMTYPDYTTAGTDAIGEIEQFDTGVNGGFAAAPDGGDILIDALYELKDAYRSNATWYMNRKTMAAVRKLKDSNGAYLWMPGITAGQPATVLGYPTAAFEDMADIATGSLSIAVGDMGEAYQIVDRVGIRVIRDIFTVKPFIEFYSTKRVGGDVVNFEALKIIKFAA